jgi:hypothetical protein
MDSHSSFDMIHLQALWTHILLGHNHDTVIDETVECIFIGFEDVGLVRTSGFFGFVY